MRAIELFRLRRVRDKSAALAAMQRHAQLSAQDAQAALHSAIGGGRPRISCESLAAARACITQLRAAGFLARVAGIDHANHAQEALRAAWPQLTPAVQQECAAQLLEGDWQHALWSAQHHLATHAPASRAARLLATAALDCGLWLDWV